LNGGGGGRKKKGIQGEIGSGRASPSPPKGDGFSRLLFEERERRGGRVFKLPSRENKARKVGNGEKRGDIANTSLKKRE